jgi:hypothetical protein
MDGRLYLETFGDYPARIAGGFDNELVAAHAPGFGVLCLLTARLRSGHLPRGAFYALAGSSPRPEIGASPTGDPDVDAAEPERRKPSPDSE